MHASLQYTPEIKKITDPIYDRLRGLIPEIEWAVHAPLIARIDELKRERNAVVLAHNYMTPEIFHGVADVGGDSLALARRAAQSEAEVIVMAGVHFMAETAKLLNPRRTVLTPDPLAGCSLAESIGPADVRRLRALFPGVPVVTYVNTSAAVKAETDICCTSGNAVEVVRSLRSKRVVFLPDEYLGRWVQKQLPELEIILWQGHCEVHQRFNAAQIDGLRQAHQGLTVLAHPECPPEVLEVADHVGSTAGMIDYLRAHRPPRVALITECSMSDNVAAELPEIELVRPCALCPHMKRITLANICQALETMQHPVQIDPEVADRARASIARMLAVT
jgi:quinolinate synthase